jgi:hypothetical protein
MHTNAHELLFEGGRVLIRENLCSLVVENLGRCSADAEGGIRDHE